MTFALDFAQDVDAVIVAKSTGHLVVVHGEMVLLDAPQLCQASWIHNLEHACFSAFPCDEVAVALSWIVQKLL